jgi:hypothetical protein
MSKTGKPAQVRSKRLTLGLGGFEKISAVEGIRLTRDLKTTLRSLDERQAAAAERRSAIIKKYGRSS